MRSEAEIKQAIVHLTEAESYACATREAGMLNTLGPVIESLKWVLGDNNELAVMVGKCDAVDAGKVAK